MANNKKSALNLENNDVLSFMSNMKREDNEKPMEDSVSTQSHNSTSSQVYNITSTQTSENITKRATWYISTDLLKRLKILAATLDGRDQSQLVNEALRDLLVKYERA